MTAVIEQYRDLKKRHSDVLLLFRSGDFYHMFFEDAREAAEILGITLTRGRNLTDENGKSVEQASFPFTNLDTYLPKLIRAGKRVAICDQI